MDLKPLILFTLLAAAMAATTEAQSLEGCRKECGGVEIPYPFGVGKNGTGHNCFLEEPFNLICDTSTPKPKLLFYGSLPVSNISVQDGLMDISIPVVNICGNQSDYFSLDAGNFTISTSENKIVSMGCNALGMISGSRGNRTDISYSGCLTVCYEFPDDACLGTGCCEAEIPTEGLTSIYYGGERALPDYVEPLGNFCVYAFVVKKDSFKFSHHYLPDFRQDMTTVVLNWSVSNVTCQHASGHCACKSNAVHVLDTYDDSRYKCKCKSGFEGNPYYQDGCHDVDECKIPNNCSRPEQCHNLVGSYSCSCRPLYKGDGHKNGTGCTLDSQLIALGSSIALLLVFTLLSTSCWAYKHGKLKQLRRRNFEQNGGNMLQQKLSQQEGYSDRTKIFAEVELKRATNNFDEGRILGCGRQGIVYKGILPDNTLVAIKKSRVGGHPQQIKDFINKVFVLSQINHRNVVKLLGCCLETEVPLLVYEFVDNGTLLDHINPLNECSITWETRLRIATETAEAISYLHSYASIPIIHQDVKSINILMDHNLRAKVSDLEASKLILLDETHVTTVVQGTPGYLDPEYLHLGEMNDKSDVYSFGIVLMELLTANKAVDFNRPEQKNLATYFVSLMKEDRLWEIIDRRVLEHNNAEQLKEVALLARRCIRVKREERPTMKKVAMELEGLISMGKHLSGKREDLTEEKSEYLLDHVLDGHEGASTSNSTTSYDNL